MTQQSSNASVLEVQDESSNLTEEQVKEWYTALSHKQRREFIKTIAKLDTDMVVAAKNAIPTVGSQYTITKERGDFKVGDVVEVLASGKGNGGWTYAMVGTRKDDGGIAAMRMVPIKELTQENRVIEAEEGGEA